MVVNEFGLAVQYAVVEQQNYFVMGSTLFAVNVQDSYMNLRVSGVYTGYIVKVVGLALS